MKNITSELKAIRNSLIPHPDNVSDSEMESNISRLNELIEIVGNVRTEQEIRKEIFKREVYISLNKKDQKIGFSGVVSDRIKKAEYACEVLEWCIKDNDKIK